MSPFAKPPVDPSLLAQQGSAGRSQAAAQTLRGIGAAADPRGAGQAAQDFEAMFLAQMLKPMFAGIGTDGMFGGGPGEEVFREMMVDEYGKAIARAGGVGIADQVKAEMLKLQEVE
jgi:Rod binding domain-containing protein